MATVPANRLEDLARYGMAAKAQQLSQMSEGRRLATLLATTRRLKADATDDALEVLDALMKKTASRVDGEGVRTRLRGLPALDEAALALREALLVAIEGGHETVDNLLAAVFRTVPNERILDAAEAVAGLARNRVRADLIAEHWDDILRVAGSLLTRTVRASDILKVLQADGKPRSLGRAIAELGKLPKTVHLLNYLNDAAYRSTIGGQFNLHEQRHSLARAVFFGKKGEVRKRYREG